MRIDLDQEWLDAIEHARGLSTAEEFVVEAVKERLWTQRCEPLDIDPVGGTGPFEDIYAAIVILDGGREAVLAWRCHLPGLGDSMLPVIARDENGMHAWNEIISMELNVMEGPPVRWRRWSRKHKKDLDWLRRELEYAG